MVEQEAVDVFCSELREEKTNISVANVVDCRLPCVI